MISLELPWSDALLRLTVISFAIGFATLFIGMLAPRKFNFNAFPYKLYQFENEGKAYWAIGLPKWKNKMPDASRMVKSMARKTLKDDTSAAYMERLAVETCVAETTHWVLILLSPLFFLAVPDIRGAVYAVLYSLCNLPFIAIQRYNRPRLIRAMEMRRARESKRT